LEVAPTSGLAVGHVTISRWDALQRWELASEDGVTLVESAEVSIVAGDIGVNTSQWGDTLVDGAVAGVVAEVLVDGWELATSGWVAGIDGAVVIIEADHWGEDALSVGSERRVAGISGAFVSVIADDVSVLADTIGNVTLVDLARYVLWADSGGTEASWWWVGVGATADWVAIVDGAWVIVVATTWNGGWEDVGEVVVDATDGWVAQVLCANVAVATVTRDIVSDVIWSGDGIAVVGGAEISITEGN